MKKITKHPDDLADLDEYGWIVWVQDWDGGPCYPYGCNTLDDVETFLLNPEVVGRRVITRGTASFTTASFIAVGDE